MSDDNLCQECRAGNCCACGVAGDRGGAAETRASIVAFMEDTARRLGDHDKTIAALAINMLAHRVRAGADLQHGKARRGGQ